MSTVESMSTTERFLQYVAFDTQSVRESTTAPSAEKELALAAFLVDELKALGVEDARIGEGGVVYGSIPATPGCEANPAIGFIAHMDTSPDAPGANARPQIVRYDGGDVTLNVEKNIVFSVGQFPDILKYKGQDVIFTDGTTLLGADDKAGIAEIMQMVAWIKTHPEVPHARLCIGFTPDEEVARGTENFDIPLFGGLSKGKMVNSVRYAARLIDRLPIDQAPETTEGHEGFLHPNMAKGTVVESVVRILVRDHNRALYEEKKAFLVKLVDEMSAEFPEAKFSLEIKDSYENMKPYLDKAPKVLEIVRAAYRACGMEPQEEPIRGGTDGARLSVRGLPCPNVFTGGMNFHGVYECIPVKSLDKGAEVAVMLAKKSAEVTSLQ